MLEKKKETRTSASVKSVPFVVQSSKYIEAQKKDTKVRDIDGSMVTLEELANRSKEGVSGKKKPA
jgi:bisphosphoglycerate-independent phosphoglycerate mutase (AlkP superfamily)